MKGDGFWVNFTADEDKRKEFNDDPNRQSEYYSILGIERKPLGLKYTKENLLQLVNGHFDCHFKNVVIDNYNIHPNDREITCESPKQ